MAKLAVDRQKPGRPAFEPDEKQEALLDVLLTDHEAMEAAKKEFDRLAAKRQKTVLKCKAANIGSAAMGRKLDLSTARMGALLASAEAKVKNAADAKAQAKA